MTKAGFRSLWTMAALLEPADAAEATPGRSLSGFLAVTISRGGAKTVAHRLEPRASEGTLQASKAAMPQEAPLQLRKGAGHPTSLASNGDASGFPPTAANKGQPEAESKLRPISLRTRLEGLVRSLFGIFFPGPCPT